ncbi:MAG TPA: carboxypeptidase-like regulatory domain-containing protein [Acidobacteriaceae bacterium]|nr:carboxypeptidase-like regulatory domain-containing protein [Acidobacteriaceae bacterium]
MTTQSYTRSAAHHTIKTRRTILALLSIFFVAFTTGALAQVGTAALSGLVQDPTGAAVPAATVTLQNAQTSQQRTLHSNGAGAFTFSSVPNGDYKLTVSHAGFQSYTRTGIHLDPGDNISLTDVQLSIGAETQSVTVTSTVAGIPLDNGQISSTITANDLERLSVVGRDATELQKILPGFAIRNLGPQNTAPDFSQVTVGQPTPYASNGAPVAGITLKLDGANLTDAGNFGSNLQNINDGFVSEVQVQTSNFGADQSNGPVVIQGATKSGTSAYHGSLYTYARTSVLNSNDWLAKYNGIARPNDRFVYPGGTISGPIPHSRKLTFLAGAEVDAQRNVFAYGSAGSAIIHALVPTAAMRKGDFSQASLNAFLGPMATNGNYGTFNVAPTRGDDDTDITTTGNIAPWLNPGAMAIVNGTLPLPTRLTGTDGYNYDQLDLVNNNVNQYVGRVDYAISPRNLFFARYSFEKSRDGQPLVPYYEPTSVMGEVNTPGYGINNDIWVHSAAANYVTVFTPTLTNELYLTITSFVQSFDARQIAALQKSAINYPYNGAFDNGDTQYPQLGTYTTYGGLPLGLWPDYSNNPLELKKLQPNVGDNITKVWGTHTVKFGIFSQKTINNQTATNPSTNGIIQDYYYGGAGSYFADYNGTYPDGSPAYGLPHFNSGNALANFFEGQIQDWHQQNFNPYTNLYFWNTDFYGQDTWRITHNFVATYGLRVSHEGAWQDAHGIGASIWNPALYTTAKNPTTNPLPGFTWHGLNKSIPNSGVGNTPIFWEPRFGFALDVFSNGKTVVRGGVGAYRFHDSVVDVTSMFAQAENVRYTDLQGFGDNTLEGVNTLHLNPVTYGNAGGTETSIPLTTVYGLDPTDNKEPVTNNYSLSIAQQMPKNWIMQVSYVGNNSNSLMDNGTTQTVVLDNVNAIPVGYLFTPAAATAINNQSGYQACNPKGCTPQQAASLDSLFNYPGDKSYQSARPYPNYSQILVPHHNTFANYNALQVEAIKQIGRLNFNANYTFSKALGILGSSADFNWTAGIDPFNLYANYGPMNFDRTQILNLSYSYQTGKFTDQHMLGGFINNWLISGITNISSGPNMQTGVSASPGYYVQGVIGSGASQYGVSNTTILGTPDVNLQPVLKCNPKSGLSSHQYLNGSCFALPALGTNGPAIEPYAHGPAFFNSDLTLEKGFSIGGERHLRIRYAAFNFLNHPLNSFGTGYASQTTLQLSDTSANATPQTATYNPATGFGSAPQKLGRRLSEVSLKFDF